MSNGWIGVDLDGTLAEYHGWPPDGSIGAPISAMVDRVKAWIAEGKDVRVFTARIYPLGTISQTLAEVDARIGARVMEAAGQRERIRSWCKEHIGADLAVTCIKDYAMVELWDDRAVQVLINTGARADGQ